MAASQRAAIHRGGSLQAAPAEGAGTSQASKRQRIASSAPAEVRSNMFDHCSTHAQRNPINRCS